MTIKSLTITLSSFLLCSTTLLHSDNIQEVNPQNAMEIYPDTVLLNYEMMYALYKSGEKDTLGFRAIDYKTSLDEYKGKEKRHIIRAMRDIKRSIRRYSISTTLAREELTMLTNSPQREGETIVLINPKYQVTKKGVMLVVQRIYAAPWNDIVTNWVRMDAYFIGFDKNVKLIETYSVNRKPLPIGVVTYQSMTYEYQDEVAGDTIANRTPPTFEGGEDELKKFIVKNTRYSDVAIENYIQGNTSIRFTVNSDNRITNISTYKGIDMSVDRELVRTIKLLGNGMWKAGTIDGKEVATDVTIKVNFKLKE